MKHVLITGGAGFIGSHVVDLLLERGYDVTILDSLEKQVHGSACKRPAYLSEDVKLITGNALDREVMTKLLKATDAVIHLAATVGIGQSMYQIDRYVEVNTRGTALLLDILVNESVPVRKIVIASSMSVYGEGKYICRKCCSVQCPAQRRAENLSEKQWNHLCPKCGAVLSHAPTDEDSTLHPTSIYALTKRHQEEMCLIVGKTYEIPTVAMRFFNVYGPRQALSNPYTGVCAIFSNRILNGKSPFLFEDGEQLRDFVHVRDVARACLLAIERTDADYEAINVGTGNPVTISAIAQILGELYGAQTKPSVSQEFRTGDVRHVYADTTKAKQLLGFEAKVRLREGLNELVQWAREHEWKSADLFEQALVELRDRQLAQRTHENSATK